MKDERGNRMPKGASRSRAKASKRPVGRVVELFAGVGGFRLGLEGPPPGFEASDLPTGDWQVLWSNQWEPSTKRQHAWECYARNFGVPEEEWATGNDDISAVLDRAADPSDSFDIPEHDLLVGGFPCQDYSVAKPLNQAHGIQGKRGVLWWEIHRLLEMKRPRFLLLENVDRLLKSPARQRGRDFAIILATLNDLGYLVEWRVINAADYGFAQRRRRVFIAGKLVDHVSDAAALDGNRHVVQEGVLARAFPVADSDSDWCPHLLDFKISGDAYEVSSAFGHGKDASPFREAGIALARNVWTRKVEPARVPARSLGSVMLPDAAVEPHYFVPEEKIASWAYLKGAKREERTHKVSGAPYMYSEGALPFPDPIDRPARTVLTGEGGSGPSRFKHVVVGDSGRRRRLAPIELERLNGFPDDWTAGMSDARRAFCMGNALVVGVVQRIGEVLAADMRAETVERESAVATR